MKRYHEERARIRSEHRFHLRRVHGWPKEPVNCECELQAGRFRKKKALDCGKAACLLCHYEKIFGIASHQDRVRLLRANDSLADYFEKSRRQNVERRPGKLVKRPSLRAGDSQLPGFIGSHDLVRFQLMLCFEVWINGKKERVIGCKSAEEYGVYLSAYPNVSSDSVSMEMSGYALSDQIYPDELRWGMSELQPDDEVLIRVVRTDAPDPPTRSRYAEGQIDDPPKVIICSNCGRSHQEVEQMITAQRITLCGECCREIAEFISDEN